MVEKLSRSRLFGLLLIVFAIGFLLTSGWLVYDDARSTYQLRITDSHDTQPDSDALAYENLPPEAKTAFEKARNGDYDTHHRPAYLDTFPLTTAVDVHKEGTTYELWATERGFTGASLSTAIPITLVGIVLGVFGIRLSRHSGGGAAAGLAG